MNENVPSNQVATGPIPSNPAGLPGPRVYKTRETKESAAFDFENVGSTASDMHLLFLINCENQVLAKRTGLLFPMLSFQYFNEISQVAESIYLAKETARMVSLSSRNPRITALYASTLVTACLMYLFWAVFCNVYNFPLLSIKLSVRNLLALLIELMTEASFVCL